MSGPAGADVLEAWKQAGLVEVDLPSGFRVRIRPVSPTQLITGGLLPFELIGAMVEAAESGERPSDEMLGKATLAYVGREQELAARAVRDIWNGEAWEPIEIAPETFASGAFDQDDIDAITEATMVRIRAAAEKEGVDAGALAEFPEVGPGAADQPDGGAVRAAPVRPRRDRRAAGRPAVRRGSHVPPGEG